MQTSLAFRTESSDCWILREYICRLGQICAGGLRDGRSVSHNVFAGGFPVWTIIKLYYLTIPYPILMLNGDGKNKSG